MQAPEHVDVLIIGAGISGIGAAWHIQDRCPDHTWAILEGRDAVGGTWDLFRYPGIRSDSDMYTLGYRFRPWRDAKSIADGPSIKAYLEEVARESGILPEIRFGHRVVGAEWSSEDALWSVEAEVGPDRSPARFTCGFLYACTGYYRYDRGYLPEWSGTERFCGRIVHPQHWPEDLDYAGKRVVVIGSGATAVTLVPALAHGPGAAARVTMLQRSPTYVVALPGEDRIARLLRRFLPERTAYALTRWKNVLLQSLFYQVTQRAPGLAKRLIRAGVERALGGDFDIDTHFTPRYDPWDERLCVAPDGDFFRAIREGRASVVTDHIETFTETGIRLRSGDELEADVVVTATGLDVDVLAGVELAVDGRRVRLADEMSYRGVLHGDVPNLATSIGYTNASWTLRSDLVAEYVCRLLAYMRRHGYGQCTPRPGAVERSEEAVFNLESGYLRRAQDRLPKQGSDDPWRFHHNYFRDILTLRHGRVDGPDLEFRTLPAVEPDRETTRRGAEHRSVEARPG